MELRNLLHLEVGLRFIHSFISTWQGDSSSNSGSSKTVKVQILTISKIESMSTRLASIKHPIYKLYLCVNIATAGWRVKFRQAFHYGRFLVSYIVAKLDLREICLNTLPIFWNSENEQCPFLKDSTGLPKVAYTKSNEWQKIPLITRCF